MATTNGEAAADVPLVTDGRHVHFDDASAKASRANSTSARTPSPKQSIIASSTIVAIDECCANVIDSNICTNNAVILLFMGVNIIVFAYALLFFADHDNVYLCCDRWRCGHRAQILPLRFLCRLPSS